MATVLRILESETAKHANLAAYLKRCTARPAFQRALAAQMGDFKAAA
jgi:glutathione S-transferase